MEGSDNEPVFQPHTSSDSEAIVAMVNRDPFHMLNGITVAEFERHLDEPGERVRDHTFVVRIGGKTAGYLSLCFVAADSHSKVYCYGTVDQDFRRRGIGTAMFRFIFARLDGIARREGKPIRFIHRSITSIPGEASLGIRFGMKEQHILEVLCLRGMDEGAFSRLMPGLQFRAPTVSDAALWADIYNKAFGGSKKPESVVYEFQGSDFSPKLYALAVNEAGEPVGFVCSSVKGSRGRIPTIAVKPEWQRRGIGEALLTEILRRLKQEGAEEIRLSVDSRNDAAKALYGKRGFQLDYKRIHYEAEFLP